MSDLVRTYNQYFNNNKQSCINQDQGTCGLVSFWYAAQLLEKGQAKIPFPRRTNLYLNGSPCVKHGESMRHFAKSTCNSAQGELLSSDEMRLLVKAFGFKCDVFQNPDLRWRQRFIRNALTAQHPVLIAYSWDNLGGHNQPDPTGALDADGGAHWSLIIGIQGECYLVLEPNTGNELKKWDQIELLQANAKVDDMQFTPLWMKTQRRDRSKGLTGKQRLRSGPDVQVYNSQLNPLKIYDLYKNRLRQDLANVLVAVKK